jgi:hypothetical protein
MTLWVPLNVAKHIEEEGLGEGVEVGQGLPALGSEGFGLVQDGGNAALLFQWGNLYGDSLQVTNRHARLIDSFVDEVGQAITKTATANQVFRELGCDLSWVRSKTEQVHPMDKLLRYATVHRTFANVFNTVDVAEQNVTLLEQPSPARVKR